MSNDSCFCYIILDEMSHGSTGIKTLCRILHPFETIRIFLNGCLYKGKEVLDLRICMYSKYFEEIYIYIYIMRRVGAQEQKLF